MELNLTELELLQSILIETVRTEAYVLAYIQTTATSGELEDINKIAAKKIDDIAAAIKRRDHVIHGNSGAILFKA